MRVLIVGLGVVGAMAAWRLARAGYEVVACEQYGLDHDRGSSYGDSRIIRRVYPDPLYTNLMADAYPLWDELQAHFPDEELFCRSGGLYCAPGGHPLLGQALTALAASGAHHEVLDAEQVTRRYPAFHLACDEQAVFEPSMGYARASRCVRAAAHLARQAGADLREHTAVADIQADDNGVRVTTRTGETLHADRLLLTAGPWTGPYLKRYGVSLPLIVTRQAYIHLEPRHDANAFLTGQFPVWIDAATNYYGFPRLGDVPGVKIALHERGETTTPDDADRAIRADEIATTLRYAQRRFPDLSDTVSYAKVCLYTNTPDEDFILDAVPGLPHTFIVAGLSGHGFKFAPLLGQILADLAADNLMRYDLTRFRIGRFDDALPAV